MGLNSDQGLGQAAPYRMMEPELAAWAEKTTLDSTDGTRSIWYGAVVFWIVVCCIVAARIMFLDPNRIQPATASSATHSTLAGASNPPDGTKL